MEVKPGNFLARINAERASGIHISEDHTILEIALKEYLENYPEEDTRLSFLKQREALTQTPLSDSVSQESSPFIIEVAGKQQVLAVKNPDELRKIVDKIRSQTVNTNLLLKEDELEVSPYKADVRTRTANGIDLNNLNKGEEKNRDVQLTKEANLSLIEMRRSALYGKLANDISSTALVKGYIRNRKDASVSKKERMEKAGKAPEVGKRIQKNAKKVSATVALAMAYRHKKKKDKKKELEQKALEAIRDKRAEEANKASQEEREQKQQQREAYHILYLKALRDKGYSVKG